MGSKRKWNRKHSKWSWTEFTSFAFKTIAHFVGRKKIGTKMVARTHSHRHTYTWKTGQWHFQPTIVHIANGENCAAVVGGDMYRTALFNHKRNKRVSSRTTGIGWTTTKKENFERKRIKWNGCWTKNVHVFSIGGLNDCCCRIATHTQHNSEASRVCFALSCVAQIYKY